jgi:hypothetical protein
MEEENWEEAANECFNEKIRGGDIMGGPAQRVVILSFQHLRLTDLEQEKWFTSKGGDLWQRWCFYFWLR